MLAGIEFMKNIYKIRKLVKFNSLSAVILIDAINIYYLKAGKSDPNHADSPE
jgi:hypothetical protein